MKSKTQVVLGVVVVLIPMIALGGIIEGTEFPIYALIDDEFATTEGALFSSNMGFVTLRRNGGTQGPLGISGTDADGYGPEFGFSAFFAPIEVTFVDPANESTPGIVNGSIIALWGDGGGDFDLLRLRAYDLSGDLLGTVNSSGTTWQTISFTGSGIHRVIFDQAPNALGTSDTFIDRLSFPTPVPVPEPSTIALLAIGSVVVARRRKLMPYRAPHGRG